MNAALGIAIVALFIALLALGLVVTLLCALGIAAEIDDDDKARAGTDIWKDSNIRPLSEDDMRRLKRLIKNEPEGRG